jgi:hypothetical protein
MLMHVTPPPYVAALDALSPRVFRTLAAEHEADYVFQAATLTDTGQRAWYAVCGCGHTTQPTRSMSEAIRDHGDHRGAIFTAARARLAEADDAAHDLVRAAHDLMRKRDAARLLRLVVTGEA